MAGDPARQRARALRPAVLRGADPAGAHPGLGRAEGASSTCPLATGESLYSRYEFLAPAERPRRRHRAARHLRRRRPHRDAQDRGARRGALRHRRAAQPDGAARHRGEPALLRGLISNFKILEYRLPLDAPYVKDPYLPEDGYLQLRPDRPGWGVEIDEEFLAQRPLRPLGAHAAACAPTARWATRERGRSPAMSLEFRLLADTRCGVGEGPIWDDRRECLFFVDVTAPAVHAIRLDGSDLRTWPMPTGAVGSRRPRRERAPRRRAPRAPSPCSTRTPARSRPSPTCRTSPPPTASTTARSARTAPSGSARWTTGRRSSPSGSLYRVDGRGRVDAGDRRRARRLERPRLDGATGAPCSTPTRAGAGSTATPSTPSRASFATGPASSPTSRRRPAAPTARACDAEGFYWSAGVSAGRLNRWSRDGRLVETHPVPVPSPTMPCFCGPDLRTLVVTSLRPGGADHNHAGGLFIASAPIAGAPVARWMDR